VAGEVAGPEDFPPEPIAQSPARDSWWKSRTKFFDGRATAVTSGFLLYAGLKGYDSWWKEERRFRFHVIDEGFFGRNTYTGGADKVSHFIASYIASQALAKGYILLGKSPQQSQLIGAGVSALTGLIIEVGDGFHVFGLSWGDILTNTLGAAAGAEISRRGWDDVVGFRIGTVRYEIPPPGERSDGLGQDYSREVYSADLKLNGLLRRAKIKPGVARFLLLSLTYGSKGYRYHSPKVRERNIGMDIGLNLPEIFRALGVRDDSWWGKPFLEYLNYRRIPLALAIATT